MSLEALAKGLYDACLTPKPEWGQLGDVTKSVWLERAAEFAIFNEDEDIEMPGKINIKTIQARLDGVPITGEFITTTLGVEPTERDKRLVLWDDAQYPDIVDKLIAHIKSKRTSSVVAEKPAPKPKKGGAKSSNADGFNFGGEGEAATGGGADGFNFGGEDDAAEGEFKF